MSIKVKKFIMVTIVIFVIMIMLGILYGYRYYQHIPRINPHPKYFITVKGHIDSRISKTTKLHWEITYHTTNRDLICRDVDDWIEGADSAKIKNVEYITTPNSNGRYSLRIPLDQYKLGYCGWMPINLGYSTFYHDHALSMHDEILFSDKKIKANHITRSVWNCKIAHDKPKCYFNSRLYKKFNDDGKIFYKQNNIYYIIDLNYKNED